MPCEFRRALEVRCVGLGSTRSCFGSTGRHLLSAGSRIRQGAIVLRGRHHALLTAEARPLPLRSKQTLGGRRPCRPIPSCNRFICRRVVRSFPVNATAWAQALARAYLASVLPMPMTIVEPMSRAIPAHTSVRVRRLAPAHR
jgi:hypothetical protein